MTRVEFMCTHSILRVSFVCCACLLFMFSIVSVIQIKYHHFFIKEFLFSPCLHLYKLIQYKILGTYATGSSSFYPYSYTLPIRLLVIFWWSDYLSIVKSVVVILLPPNFYYIDRINIGPKLS